MTPWQPFRTRVEPGAAGVRVIRAAGVLDRPAAERLLRLVDAQLHLRTATGGALDHLVVDLAEVTRFDPAGLDALHLRWRAREHRGVRLHLAGCSGRILRLPLRAGHLVRDLGMFPSVEVAVAQLSAPAVGVPAPRPPSDPPAPGGERVGSRGGPSREGGRGQLARAGTGTNAAVS